MRKLVFYLLFLFCVTTFAQNDFSNWETNYKEVLRKAKKNKKNILVYFSGSDWCGPCKALKNDFFSTEKFKELSKEINLLYIDVPRRIDVISPEQLLHNKKLITKYNQGKTFPMVVFLNRKGKMKNKISGYSMIKDTSQYFKMLRKYIK